MSHRTKWIVLVLAVIGFGVASEAAWIHHKLLTDPSYISPCDVNERFNCSQVYLSQYGSVKGVPVAVGGMIWFGLVALIAGFASTDGRPEEQAAGGYVFVLATIGLASILSLAYASFFVLKTYCLLCMATYVCVIGIFIAAGMASSVPMMSLPGRLMADLKSGLASTSRMAATVVYALVIGVTLVFFMTSASAGPSVPNNAPPSVNGGAAAGAASAGQSGQDDVKAQVAAWWNSQTRIETGVPLNGAKVVIVKFSDFQCPGCRQTYYNYKPIIEKYEATMPKDVRYVMKDFPLNSNCNVAVQTQMHPFSCEASVAYRAAEARGKGKEMEEWLFANQPNLTSDLIRKQTQTMLGVSDFDREAAVRLPGIRKDSADGGALQVNSTPTYYINGVKLPTSQWLNPEYFDYVIQLELKRAAPAGQ